ncbi:UdgX family uracil-DNA binding protein [Tistrella mobilis]|uniref:Type-4 uracil-DNA glycosylase n=1 Tax=Tistrella mobilis (strain KA081020-065) TaxID=1110502 RepID=I3TTB7_TISMK|nr:UdgX family uracil-DNA binding protein [Tistrella mobilis]AFK56005.1 phage SPO1 DNA polymerase-related protein [Tistrella mobilis KA081020-065]
MPAPSLDGHPDGQTSIRSLDEARRQAEGCRRCDLWANATRTVFGEGPPSVEGATAEGATAEWTAAEWTAGGPRLMLVGEQPGDREDRAGHPFVGPAGAVLNRALAEAGIDRARVYLTNAVKHFKNEPRGKRRLHRRPDAGEIDRCRWWLELERRFVRPQVIVALGASAARALTGHAVTISRVRGRVLTLDATGVAPAARLLVTTHPSYILRQRDDDARRRILEAMITDLVLAARQK